MYFHKLKKEAILLREKERETDDDSSTNETTKETEDSFNLSFDLHAEESEESFDETEGNVSEDRLIDLMVKQWRVHT